MLNPTSPYSFSKASATLFCRMMKNLEDIPAIIIRPFLTYGPFQSTKTLIPYVIFHALENKEIKITKGEQKREFNYVSDIVDGIIKASITPRAIGEIINLGNGRQYKIRDVVNKILSIIKPSIPLKFGALPYRKSEIWNFYCENKKAKEILGWKPTITLDKGLKLTIQWYKQNIDLIKRLD